MTSFCLSWLQLALLLICHITTLGPATSHANQNLALTDSHTFETMELGEEFYTIPPPWAGNRIDAPSLPMSAFSKIPPEHTRNGTTLYVIHEAHGPLLQLLTAARESGIELQVESGYRSRGYQKKIFLKMMSEGRNFNDIVRYVAPPGYSEHALGTAVDFYPSNWRFANLPAYNWLKTHAASYGFRETYSQHNSSRFPWEAWHWAFHPAPSTEQALGEQPAVPSSFR